MYKKSYRHYEKIKKALKILLEKYVYQLIFKHVQDPENYFLQQSKGVKLRKFSVLKYVEES